MFLSLTSTAPNATDLGFLLHKHPDRVQRFDLSVGTAHVFYPQADDDRCTVALLVEVDPIGLVRGRRFGGEGFALAQYVNDRPYAASSMLAVALGRVFRSAMRGRCPERPDLEGAVLPLQIHLPSLPSSGGAQLVERLFAPLGWQVTASTRPLDPEVPRWGESRYVDTHLAGTMPLDLALSHLYVLLPVLDGAKHYWVSTEEIDKLVRGGGTWLQAHPDRDLIMRRYLAHQSGYVNDAAERLAALDDTLPPVEVPETGQEEPETGPVTGPVTGEGSGSRTGTVSGQPEPLVRTRRAAVLAELRTLRATRVVDLGCGEGALLRELLDDPAFTEIVGVDVAPRELDLAARRLDLDRLPDRQRARLSLLQSSVTYRDARLEGYDAIVLMEVIEHLDPERLPALERTVFAHARPAAAVVTTPNSEFNVRYDSLAAGTMRHPDHRFEWSRAEFEAWAAQVGDAHGYHVRFAPVGEPDPDLGPPTQMAIFTRVADARAITESEPREEVSA